MTDWLRLWHDMPTDPKWRVIARRSGKPLPCVIALYTLMLTTASAADDRGSIASLTDEDAAAALDIDEEDVAAIRSAMAGRVIDGDRLTGWERRQPKRERENDDSSQRVKRHRDAKANAVTGNVTPCNTMQRQETPREEKKREDKNKTPLTPQGGSLPDWVPGPEWLAFEKMRRAIRKPMTDDARKLALGKLSDLRDAGNDPARVLNQSVMNSWQGLFEVKEAHRTRAGPEPVVGL